jgi:hypothetical protein
MQVMAVRERVLGEVPPNTLTSILDLASTFLSLNRKVETISLIKIICAARNERSNYLSICPRRAYSLIGWLI